MCCLHSVVPLTITKSCITFRCKSTQTLKYVLNAFYMRDGKQYTCAICDPKNKLNLDLTLEEAGITNKSKIYAW